MNTNPLAFTFVTPQRLVVGWGAATDGRLVAESRRLGRRPLLVTGKSLRTNGFLPTILANLKDGAMKVTTHERVPPEPDIEDVQAALNAAESAGCDMVIAIGGGSVLDVAKAVAALVGKGHTARDYFDGTESVPESGGLPLLAVPTTAGTGSEATWVGVFVDRQNRRKASIRGGAMLPACAVLDAALTVSCPPTVTARSGMDAFVQSVESYTSSGANPLTDALSFEAARLTGQNLRTAYAEPTNQHAREALLLGSYLAGAALNTSRLGLVHGLAHPIGAITGAAHGLLCGLLMPPVIRYNADVAGSRYAAIAREVGAHDGNLHAFTDSLLLDLKIPTRLSEIGLKESDLDDVAREAMPSGSTKANPRPVSESDARAVAAAVL